MLAAGLVMGRAGVLVTAAGRAVAAPAVVTKVMLAVGRVEEVGRAVAVAVVGRLVDHRSRGRCCRVSCRTR
jgi:hypothetical protein